MVFRANVIFLVILLCGCVETPTRVGDSGDSYHARWDYLDPVSFDDLLFSYVKINGLDDKSVDWLLRSDASTFDELAARKESGAGLDAYLAKNKEELLRRALEQSLELRVLVRLQVFEYDPLIGGFPIGKGGDVVGVFVGYNNPRVKRSCSKRARACGSVSGFGVIKAEVEVGIDKWKLVASDLEALDFVRRFGAGERKLAAMLSISVNSCDDELMKGYSARGRTHGNKIICRASVSDMVVYQEDEISSSTAPYLMVSKY